MATEEDRGRRSRAFALAGGLLFLAVVASATYTTAATDREIERASFSFLEAARGGDIDGAYAALTVARRSRLTPRELASLISAPIYTEWTDADRRGIETWGGPPADEACASFTLRAADGLFGLELELRREGESFRVHDLAAAPLRDPMPHLLDRCGPRSGL
jgi:hypothetical protein